MSKNTKIYKNIQNITKLYKILQKYYKWFTKILVTKNIQNIPPHKTPTPAPE